jgi:hypothetical protein
MKFFLTISFLLVVLVALSKASTGGGSAGGLQSDVTTKITVAPISSSASPIPASTSPKLVQPTAKVDGVQTSNESTQKGGSK